MPHTPKQTTNASQEKTPQASYKIGSIRSLVGGVMIIAGTITLAQQLTGFNVWRYSWPLLLIIVGIFIIRKWK